MAVVDTVTREALAIEVDTSLPGERVVRVRERIAAERGVPGAIVLDNGPELTGRALDQWAYGRGVQLRLSKSGRKLYGGLIGAAAERDAKFRNCLSANEKTVFERALVKLAGQARDLIRQEKK